MVAPTAMHQLAHPEGEVATARAAVASNTIMIFSYNSTCTIEEVASSCNAVAVRFFQIYIFKKRDITSTLVQRAERCGYKAIVLTVDTPRLGRREADIKNKMVAPQLRNFDGLIATEVSMDGGSNIEAYARSVYDDNNECRWRGVFVSILDILIQHRGQTGNTPAQITQTDTSRLLHRAPRQEIAYPRSAPP